LSKLKKFYVAGKTGEAEPSKGGRPLKLETRMDFAVISERLERATLKNAKVGKKEKKD